MHTEVLLATLTYLAQIFTALLVVLLLTAYTPSHLLGMATQSGWSMKSWLDSWWSGESLSVAARQRRARRRELASKRQDEDRKRVFGDAPCGLINTGNSCFINSTLQVGAAYPFSLFIPSSHLTLLTFLTRSLSLSLSFLVFSCMPKILVVS